MKLRAACASLVVCALIVGVGACSPADPSDPAVREWIEQTPPAPAVLVSYAAPESVEVPFLAEGDPQLPLAINDFGFELLGQVIEEPGGGSANTILSPLSAHAALTMAANGARSATAAEMLATLGIDDLGLAEANRRYAVLLWTIHQLDGLTGSRVSVANAIWPDARLDVDPGFVETNRQFFGAHLETLDLTSTESAERINGWVAEQTSDHITELFVPPFNPIELYLANTVYLNAAWAHPFEESDTAPAPFAVPGDGPIDVPFMSQTEELAYVASDGLQAVRLPYDTFALGMWIVLPPEDTADPDAGLGRWLAGMDGTLWRELTSSAEERSGTLALPKFSTRFRTDLGGQLERMGMASAFGPGADFTGIADPVAGRGLFLGGAVQETYIDVHEEGTEAAAATGLAFAGALESDGAAVPFEMVVDRPFLIVIDLEPGGESLFLGCVYDPR